MKAKVNNNCIGCGACMALVPEVFDMNDEGLAEVVVEEIDKSLEDDVKDASENCPTAAIEVKE